MKLTKKQLQAIIDRIDQVTPKADQHQDQPGISLSEAVRRELRDEGHPLFSRRKK